MANQNKKVDLETTIPTTKDLKNLTPNQESEDLTGSQPDETTYEEKIARYLLLKDKEIKRLGGKNKSLTQKINVLNGKFDEFTSNAKTEIVKIKTQFRKSTKKARRELVSIKGEFKKSASDAKTEIVGIKDRFEKSTNNAQNQLAIFVALFTFVSIQFQFLSKSDITPSTLLSLSLFLLGSLIIFIMILKNTSDGKLSKSELFKNLLNTGIFLIVAGILIYLLSTTNFTKINIYQ